MSTGSLGAIVWLLAALAAPAGCGPVTLDGYRVHTPEVMPTAVETYPNVRYHTRRAYLVGNDWYYRDPRYGWVVFEDEPADLHAQRLRMQAGRPTAKR